MFSNNNIPVYWFNLISRIYHIIWVLPSMKEGLYNGHFIGTGFPPTCSHERRRLGLPEFGLEWGGLKMHPAATVKSDAQPNTRLPMCQIGGILLP